MTIRFAHVNLIARDWKRLARFYEEVFGCTPVSPERELAGEWIEEGVAVPGARIRGICLRLPGHGDDGPRLEIFQYNHQRERSETAANRPGFGHIAFEVDDIGAMRDAVIAAGGRPLGKIVSSEISDSVKVTFVYLTDPEGNIVELYNVVRDL